MSNKILICGINILFINCNTFFVKKEIPSHGYHLWLPLFCGFHPPMVTPWFPPSCGYHSWLPPSHGDTVVSTLLWLACVVTTLLWLPPSHGDSMVSILPWSLCGYHPPMVTPWFPPSHGYHAWLPPFVASPDGGDSLVSTLPWLPFVVTTLLWLHVVYTSFTCTKWLLHLQTTQISLQSHVTTLNQPIERLS